jgi:hypothetical protein
MPPKKSVVKKPAVKKHAVKKSPVKKSPVKKPAVKKSHTPKPSSVKKTTTPVTIKQVVTIPVIPTDEFNTRRRLQKYNSQDNSAPYESKTNKINSLIRKSLKINSINSLNIKQHSHDSAKFNSEHEYQNSFNDTIAFSKKFTDTQKQQINYVLFHTRNNDGIIAAYSAWVYLTNNGKDKTKTDLIFQGADPDNRGSGISRKVSDILQNMRDKHVLIVDLDYNQESYDAIKNTAASITVIDDHINPNVRPQDYIFKNGNHAACAHTFKFFNPDKEVPKIIQHVDSSDAKLQLPYLPFNAAFIFGIGVRISNNVILQRKYTRGVVPVYNSMFEIINKIFENNDELFITIIGQYMFEYRENLKEEIAGNAQIAYFGVGQDKYKVGVLNFDSPSLSKIITRQIISNAFAKNQQIDFAVLWSYHYSKGYYRVQLADDHRQTNINMFTIASNYGRHPKGEGGSGHPHMGSFYWKGDIHELIQFSGNKRDL